MSGPFLSPTLPKPGDTVRLDVTNPTLCALREGLDEQGAEPYNLDQPYKVLNVTEAGVRLLASDDTFDMLLPLEYYEDCGSPVQ